MHKVSEDLVDDEETFESFIQIKSDEECIVLAFETAEKFYEWRDCIEYSRSLAEAKTSLQKLENRLNRVE